MQRGGRMLPHETLVPGTDRTIVWSKGFGCGRVRGKLETECACSHLTVLGSRYVCVYHKTDAGDKGGTFHFTFVREFTNQDSKKFTVLLGCL